MVLSTPVLIVLFGYKLGTSLFGFVNLEFFRSSYPHFCLHPKLNVLHVVSLDFVIAMYPFFLILLTYITVTLNDNGYRVILCVLKPFKWFLSRYRRRLDLRSSLIETFATFILLSNNKILGLCFDLLTVARAYDVTGQRVTRRFAYYDASIVYMSTEHVPFVVLAFCMGSLFICLPLVLLLIYPNTCFRRLLNYFGCRCHALHIFMDAFQGAYRTSPYDMRYFSAFYPFLQILIFVIIGNIESKLYIVVVCGVMVSGAIAVAIFQPYKMSSHNTMDIVTLLSLAMFYIVFSSLIIAIFIEYQWLFFAHYLIYVSILMISIYLASISCFMSNISRTILHYICNRFPRRRQQSS